MEEHYGLIMLGNHNGRRLIGLPNQLSNQFLIRETLSLEQLQKRIPKEPRICPIIEPPFEFIEIGVHMLSRHLVVGTDERAVEEAPYVLYGVCMDSTSYPFLSAMIDCLMAGVIVPDAPVGGPVIGIDGFGVGGRVLTDEPVSPKP